MDRYRSNGLAISLAEDVWQVHVAKRSELAQQFDLVRQIVQSPDEIYFDPTSTRQRITGSRVFHYVKIDILSGTLEGNFAVTVVKVVAESSEQAHGYVSSVLFPGHLKKGLVLEWKK